MTIKKTFLALALVLTLTVAGCKPKSTDVAEEADTTEAASIFAIETPEGEAPPVEETADENGFLPISDDFTGFPAEETGAGLEIPQTFGAEEVDEPEYEEEAAADFSLAPTEPATEPTARPTAVAEFSPGAYHAPASSSIFEEAASAGAAARSGNPTGHFSAPREYSSAGTAGASHAAGSDMTDDAGYITLIVDIKVPAQEAGVLTELKVKEGDIVKLGDVLARIDDEQALMAVEVGESKLAAAERKASNDVNIEYAKAAKAVAYAEILQADEANAKVPNTVTNAEYRRLLLAHKQAELQIEQATHDYVVSKYEVDVQRTELKAAQLGVRRRVIKAPSSGIVLERFRQQGEWVKPDEQLLQLARLDVVRLKFKLDARKVPMSGVRGRNVEVTAPLLPGKSFHGKITFVDPVLISGTKYQVWVEIQNEQENGEWLLRPAMRANAELK